MNTADQILSDAIEEYNPAFVFALFSGGHDSLCATEVASRHPRFTAAVHINTGIGIEETREFVRDTCASHGWPLIEKRAVDYVRADGNPDPQRYEDFVRQYGFPGPQQHGRMYNRLKERPQRSLLREYQTKPARRIMLVTGVRKEESVIRMGRVTETQREGNRVWCAPLTYWTGDEINAHIKQCGLARNPVKDILCLSGECLCGAFAKPEERAEIAAAFPRADAEICRLEQIAYDAGVWARWGHKPIEAYWLERAGQIAMPLCASCAWKSREVAA